MGLAYGETHIDFFIPLSVGPWDSLIRNAKVDLIFRLSTKLFCHQMEMENLVQSLLQWRGFSNKTCVTEGKFLYIYY